MSIAFVIIVFYAKKSRAPWEMTSVGKSGVRDWLSNVGSQRNYREP